MWWRRDTVPDRPRAIVTPVRRVVLLLAMAGWAACAQPRSERCKQICNKEAECQPTETDEQSAFDEGDCVAACAALERDQRTVGHVERHYECLARAQGDCAKIAACR